MTKEKHEVFQTCLNFLLMQHRYMIESRDSEDEEYKRILQQAFFKTLDQFNLLMEELIDEEKKN